MSQANWAIFGVILTFDLLGLTLNAVLFLVLWRLRETRASAGFQLVAGVAVGDSLTCLLGLGMCTARVVLGYPAAFESPWVCRFFGTAGYFVFNLSGLMVSFLALERYCLVCHGQRVSMAAVWAVLAGVGVFYALPLFYERNEFTSDLTQNYCFPKESSVLVFVIDGFTNVPLLALSFSYTCIFVHCLRHMDNAYPRRVCLRALVVIALYLGCYLPKLLVTAVSLIWGASVIPHMFFLVPPVGLVMVMTINPIIALCLYNDFRDQAFAILFNFPSLNQADGLPVETTLDVSPSQ